MNGSTASRKRKALSLKNDFQYYAKHCLKIKTKSGEIVSLELNRAQQHIHGKIEEQKAATGRVRAIILKGRQQGCSTYVEGRFFHAVTQSKGLDAYILTHEQKATDNLFGMAVRFLEYSPRYVKPLTDTANAKELRFGGLDSGYRVGTAGSKGVGRSSTSQLFHGSEVGYWSNAAEHATGVMQAVGDIDGTEIILESTANGIGNYFHSQWKLAESGQSDYIAIFVPWYWQEEYRKSGDIVKTDEEIFLAKRYQLDDAQINWRRNKIIELSASGADGLKSFKQEYPMNAAEAFQVSGGDGLITAHACLKARKAKVGGNGPLIVGVDPSRGGDRFAMIKRQGRKAYDKQSWTGEQVDSLGKAVSKCKKVLDEACPIAGKRPDMMFVDSGGGADLVDRLHELGYEDRVKAIAFGASPLDEDRYKNKRAEMWGLLATWIKDENLDVEIPDDDEMQADLCASPYERDSLDRIILWKKEKIKKEYGFSPDFGDALALTFAEPVREANSIGPELTIPNSWMG